MIPITIRGPAAAGAMFGLAPAPVHADWALNLPRGVTPISQEAFDLHMLILGISVVIGIVVFSVMFYSMLKHRKSVGAVPARFHHSTTAEVIWTVIPIIILVALAVPATSALIKMEDTSGADLTIKVTGYQWKWRYEYLDSDVTVYSTLAFSSRKAINDPAAARPENYLLEVDNPIVIPADRKVRLLLTADDVIHAWWVPEFGMKKDAVPGFINEMWIKTAEIGVYRGQCAELCGRDHGFMPIVVEVKTPDEFQQWLNDTKMAATEQILAARRDWSRDELMDEGEKVYATACAACHKADGTGVPEFFPAIQGSPVATGEVAEHMKVVLEGRSGTAMRGFGTQLSDVELAAVLTYQRNAFGNETGDLVQPATISAEREL